MNNTTLIPLIRKIAPTMIAESIVDVQPMASPVGSIFNFNPNYLKLQISPIRYDENCIHRYIITVIGSHSQDSEIRDWLGETFKDDDYFIHGFEIRFNHEKHAQWFIMRWS